MEEFDILGFNPADLDIYNQADAPQGSNFSSNIYKAKPEESKDDDHVYRSTIRVIYNPFNYRDSIVERQEYAMQDANGWFTAVSKLTNGPADPDSKNCPIFKAWKSYKFSQDPAKQLIGLTKDKGGYGYFDKRFGRYVTIQVIKDKNHPELENKYMFFKLPKAISDLIDAKQKPSAASGRAAIPVMDFLWGRTIELEVTPGPGNPGDERYRREIKYTTSEISDDIVSVKNPDGTPILNSSDQAVLDEYVEKMSKVWRCKVAEDRDAMVAEINADPITNQVRAIYKTALEKIKEFCPDVRKEMGYKPWSQELTDRVNGWLAVIASGKNPADVTPAPTAAPIAQAAPAATSMADTTAPDDSDLPF